MRILIKNDEMLLQKKRCWIWFTHQFDIPVCYSYFSSLKEIEECISGIHSLSYCEIWQIFNTHNFKDYQILCNFNNIEDLKNTFPEDFI
jgi:hypothetical protein